MPLTRKELAAMTSNAKVDRLNAVVGYLGLDPGASGGIALLYPFSPIANGPQVSLHTMPDTEKDLWALIGCLCHHGTFCVIEKVQGYIGEGRPGSSMFKFGQNYGSLRMALVAAGIPFDEVQPQKWQKAHGITPKKKTENKNQFKNRLKQKAQQLFPQVEGITLATADALLIAEYCRRWQEGRL